MSSDADLALARRQGRRLRLSDVAWQHQRDLWLQSADKVQLRATRNAALLAELTQVGWGVPRPSEFSGGIRHLSGNRAHIGKLFNVPRAFGTQKQHYLSLLYATFTGVGFDDPRFFCEAFPSLKPGGAAAEFVDGRHPVWKTLQKECGVNAVPDFLKHICNKHDGEARLLQRGEVWSPLAPNIDVRDIAFWHQQFVEEEESREWLAERDPADKLLSWDNVAWVLRLNNDQTLLIRRTSVDSASTTKRWQYDIRRGRAVTLAQMYFEGRELCAAFDIYKLYLDLPLFISKAGHHARRRSGGKRHQAVVGSRRSGGERHQVRVSGAWRR